MTDRAVATSRSVAIFGLDPEVSPAELREFLGRFGDLAVLNVQSPRSRRLAFARFASAGDASAAMVEADGRRLGRFRLRLRRGP